MYADCLRLYQGRSRDSRKYEPLTQGDGLNPNHDGSSEERDVLNEFCVLRNKPLSRDRKQPTLSLIKTVACARPVLLVTMLFAPCLQVCPCWNLPPRVSVASWEKRWRAEGLKRSSMTPFNNEVFPFPWAGNESETP